MKQLKLIFHLASWNIVPAKTEGYDPLFGSYTAYKWLFIDIQIYK